MPRGDVEAATAVCGENAASFQRLGGSSAPQKVELFLEPARSVPTAWGPGLRLTLSFDERLC